MGAKCQGLIIWDTITGGTIFGAAIILETIVRREGQLSGGQLSCSHHMHICIVHKNCIITRISGWSFSLLLFCSFLLFNEKWKYKRTWFLYVTSNKGFPEGFSTVKTTKQNKEYCVNIAIFFTCDLLKLEIQGNYKKL